MNAGDKTLLLLLSLFFDLAIMVLMLRVLLQWLRADFYNPISQALIKITAPLLAPVARILPDLGRLSLSGLALLLAAQVLATVCLALVYNVAIPAPLQLLLWSLLGLLSFVLRLYFFVILIMVILSWVAPSSRHPAVALLYQLAEPAMAPFRKLLPPLGGLDLSPIFAFVAIQIARYFVQDAARSLGLIPALVIGF